MEILLERESVLAQLNVLRRRAGRGAGRVVLLRGEAGVGKTAVIRRFVSGLTGQVRVLRGACDPLATPRLLGPLVDMLAHVRDPATAGLAAAIDGGDPEAIYAGLLGLFTDGNTWVFAVEDVHWADGATLDVLRFLARRVGSLPVLLLVSYRDDEVGEQHPLAVALGDVATCAAVTRIGLARLSRDAVAVLAAGGGVNADELYRLTGGNPFFVTEVLAVGPDALGHRGLPRSVSEAVWGRLARLSAPARDSAQAAAVCGPRASAQLLEKVHPGATAALGECLDTGVLCADGAVVAFRHELARRAALEQMPAYRRQVLHARALAALAEPPIRPDTLSALAFHADQAGDQDAATRYGPAAAEQATVLGAHREAAELYALALRHAEKTPAEQKVAWLEQHAFASYLCGLAEVAARSWREAIALRHELGDRLGEGDDLRWLSHLLWPLGRSSEAREAGRASLELLEDFGLCPQLAWSMVNLAQLAAFEYDPAAAQYAARAIALGTQLGEPAVVLRARSCASLATVLRTDTGWDELEVAWRAATGTKALAEHAGIAGAIMCWTAVLHHDLDRADRYIAETTAFCRNHDLGAFQPAAAGAAALVALYRGDWAHAEAAAHDVLTRPGISPMNRAMPLLTVALVRARRGDEAVATLLDEACAGVEPVDLFRLGPLWAARAEAAWLSGDDDTACAEAQTGLAAAPAAGADPWLVGHLYRWLHLSGGPPAGTPADDPITPYRLETSGDWRAAAAAWTALGCPYDAALAQLGGDVAAVKEALATFRRLGARAAARRARQRLAQTRGRGPHSRRADTCADPHGLTRRERDVLALLARGHRDADIATILCISRKTVSNHVSAILTKLGVQNRTQAAAYAPTVKPRQKRLTGHPALKRSSSGNTN
ncbi:AAA family ATPase [Mycobacterium sp.]|uniref:helix-turn-helix transcriptional regulator n=1 Tax=Mycobacterium sp. TaxID=1785 RepID=UPI003341BA2E|nr:transcriptional regulator, luxR family [Mycobacterium sp.]